MKRRPQWAACAVAPILSALLLTSCGTQETRSESSVSTASGLKKVDSLGERLKENHQAGDSPAASAGGLLGETGKAEQFFSPILPGPVRARFVCENGSVEVSFSRGERKRFKCGEIQAVNNIKPYANGSKGLSLKVQGEPGTAWAVEMYPAAK